MINNKSQVKEAKEFAEAHSGIMFHESKSGSWDIIARHPASMSIYYWPVGCSRSALNRNLKQPEVSMSVYTDNINESSKKKRDLEKAVLAKLPEAPSFEQTIQAILDVLSLEENDNVAGK